VKGNLAVGNFFGHLNKIINMVSPSSLNIFLFIAICPHGHSIWHSNL
jgi:hypothetical protein